MQGYYCSADSRRIEGPKVRTGLWKSERIMYVQLQKIIWSSRIELYLKQTECQAGSKFPVHWYQHCTCTTINSANLDFAAHLQDESFYLRCNNPEIVTQMARMTSCVHNRWQCSKRQAYSSVSSTSVHGLIKEGTWPNYSRNTFWVAPDVFALGMRLKGSAQILRQVWLGNIETVQYCVVHSYITALTDGHKDR
jgi:hypothetical protein